jgi:hypothetical protein
MAGANVTATMMLCDAAQSVGGKLYILGGGWNLLHTRTPPSMGLAVKLEIVEELAGRPLPVVARLRTSGGEPVVDDDKPVEFGGQMELGRRPGSESETSLASVFALQANFVGPLEPGGYSWELLVDGDVVATAGFRVV